MGLFYLHGDADAVITAPSVAYLRITISMWAQHYELTRAARLARLAAEFSIKPGWLTGNLSSRIGTRDWDEAGERALIDGLLKCEGHEQPPVWIESSWLNEAKQKGLDLSGFQPKDVRPQLHRPAGLGNRCFEGHRHLPRRAPQCHG